MKALLIFFFLGNSLVAAEGFVSQEKDKYYVVNVNGSYTIFELLSDNPPSVGDCLKGDLESFGTTKLYNATKKERIEASIEDYSIDERTVATLLKLKS